VRTTSPLPRWRHQRPRVRVCLGAILLAFLVLTVWNLARGGDAAFYAAAARSMSQSWRALVFGAFDPAATVTLDKLAGFAVPQALSIAVFGMSTSALALPQVLEGLVTVWAVSIVGLRTGGPRAGLVAAAAAASTPIFVSMFAHPMEDGLLTMALAVALLWWQRAVLTARLWPLLLAGLFVGIGFQAKMMQAWFVLPALLVATVIAGGGRRPRLGRRVRAAAVLTASAVAASLAWITAIALVPAGSRPYIDGSLDDNAFAMVFGYNGLDRLVPGAVADAVGSGGSSHPGPPVAHLLAELFPQTLPAPEASPLKLLLAPYATQVGWLYPAAVAGIVLGLIRWWPRRGAGTGRRGRFALVVLLALWLATATAVLTLAHLPHTAYVAAIGVQLALLAAIGWAELVRLTRRARGGARFLLAAVLVLQSAWAVWLSIHGREPGVLARIAAVLLAVGVAAAVALALLPRRRRPSAGGRRRMRGRAALVVGTAIGLVAGPAVFSVQALDAGRDGSGGDASVGQRLTAGATAPDDFHPSAPALWGGQASLSPLEQALVNAAGAIDGGDGSRPLLLTDSTTLASAIISITGRSVLTDGGYSGTAPVFRVDDVRRLVASGTVRALAVRQGAHADDPVREVATSDACTLAQSFTDATGPGSGARSSSYDLYRCGG
jgi:4-amino-4-deoxy-L-arabinose transferase-like glycosyltransferase